MKKEDFLFYSFMVIFVATAIVTLLGVVGKIEIAETQLNMLLGAFLIELAGAVVSLFKRTDFFSRHTQDIAVSLGSAVETFDSLSDEIENVTRQEIYPEEKNSIVPAEKNPHMYLIRRSGKNIAVYQRIQVITGEQIEHLPAEKREMISTYEKSMNTLKKEWEKIKGSEATSQIDPKVREKKINLIKEMKNDLVGIIDFLEEQNIYLDDHYIEVRSLIKQLKK